MSSPMADEKIEMGDPLDPAPLFVRDGQIWIPQEACVGPWSPDALHGGPVAALCASVAEEVISDQALVTTRLSLDLVRPVPLSPLEVDARLIKTGRRVHLVEVVIRASGKEVALARVQRTSTASVQLPDLSGTGTEDQRPPDGPADYCTFDPSRAPRLPAPFLRWATELRTSTPGGLYERRAKVAWLRVYANLIPGVPLSTAASICAACDYTNALGAPAMPSQIASILFPNSDLSVHLIRPPVSQWVRMAPTSTWLDHGIGYSRCELWDEQGVLGISAVTLPLIQPGQY